MRRIGSRIQCSSSSDSLRGTELDGMGLLLVQLRLSYGIHLDIMHREPANCG